MFNYLLKNLSILKKFLFINLIFFSVIGLFTFLYLKNIQPNLIKNKSSNHIKIINLNDGLVPFDLYPYQEDMFDHFKNNRFSVLLACRQSGKSISSLAFLLWYALFNPEQTIAVLANRGATSREMLGRITLMLENLPFYLQP